MKNLQTVIKITCLYFTLVILKWKTSFQKQPSMLHMKEVKPWENLFLYQCKSRRCDIGQNYLVCKNEFTCTEVSYVVLVLIWFTWSAANYVKKRM